jgi:5'-methylthioadenosine phosphorylase
MNVTFACIAGEEIHRQWTPTQRGLKRIEPTPTPFGDSAEIFLVEGDSPYYIMPRFGPGLSKIAPRSISHRANLYALKDLGVECLLAWGAGGAITHDVAVGDLIVLSDIVDRTAQSDNTFFIHSPLGYLRQFPVFCPGMRRIVTGSLHEQNASCHDGGTAAVSEGPRLETPAEIRLLAHVGVDYVTHSFAPEAFLAKELELCYVGVMYVVNYAETGSRHRPFAGGGLFGTLTERSEAERLAQGIGAIAPVTASVAAAVAGEQARCECAIAMAGNRDAYRLPSDWHDWFDLGGAGEVV